MEDGMAESGKKRGGKKLLLILIILILLLGGAAAGLRFFAPGLIPGWGQKANGTGGDTGGEVGPTVLYPLKTFIVNLVDPSGKRYLKLTLSLELKGEKSKVEVDRKLPQIQDALLVLLSSKTYEEIDTPQGKDRLKKEIIAKCNGFVGEGQVVEVYFSDFVVQ